VTLAPVEVVVVAFPGNRFSGKILPELQRLLDAGTISIVDGLFLRKDENGDVTFVEVDEAGVDEGVAALAALFDRFDEMISDEDIEELSAALDPNSSAAVLVFEHTWVRPLRDAIVESGGVLAENFRVPPEVVAEVMAALETAS
jgi:uncharacterized membrane protein